MCLVLSSFSMSNLMTSFILFHSIPLFYLTEGGCGDTPIGVSNDNKIPDSQITSSVFRSSTKTPARNGRLNYTEGPSWCASPTHHSPYLQIDLGEDYVICAVATQGNSREDTWVKSYQIHYLINGSSQWSIYKEKHKTKVRPFNNF